MPFVVLRESRQVIRRRAERFVEWPIPYARLTVASLAVLTVQNGALLGSPIGLRAAKELQADPFEKPNSQSASAPHRLWSFASIRRFTTGFALLTRDLRRKNR